MRYLISETTKEEREKIVADSLGNINAVCDGCMAGLTDIYQDYIDGRKELRQINMEFNARYVKGGDRLSHILLGSGSGGCRGQGDHAEFFYSNIALWLKYGRSDSISLMILTSYPIYKNWSNPVTIIQNRPSFS